MSTPKQIAFCNKCGVTFHTMRAFKKHIKICNKKINLRNILETFVLYFADRDESGEFYGYDTCLGNCEVYFTEAMDKIESLYKNEKSEKGK